MVRVVEIYINGEFGYCNLNPFKGLEFNGAGCLKEALGFRDLQITNFENNNNYIMAEVKTSTGELVGYLAIEEIFDKKQYKQKIIQKMFNFYIDNTDEPFEDELSCFSDKESDFNIKELNKLFKKYEIDFEV